MSLGVVSVTTLLVLVSSVSTGRFPDAIVASGRSGTGECGEGDKCYSSKSSIWMSPDQSLGSQDPLVPYGVHGARGPLEYEIKFSCRGRRNGYYADLDHRCLVYHYCNTSREYNYLADTSTWTYAHYSFACDRGLRYDQVLAQCVTEKEAITRCQDSELYFPSGDNPNDVPVVITSNNRLIPVRCPAKTDDVNCQIANDHIDLKGCSEQPGTVIKFYSEYSADPLTVSSYVDDDNLREEAKPVPADGPVPVEDPAEARADGDEGDEDNAEEGNDPPIPAAPASRNAGWDREVTEPPPKPYAPKTNFRFRSPPGKSLLQTNQVNNNVNRQQAQAERTNFYPNVDHLDNRRAPVQVDPPRWTHTSGQVSPRVPVAPVSDVPVSVAPRVSVVPVASVVPASIPFRPSGESVAVNDASRSGESPEADFLGLPIGSTEIVGRKIDTSFDCSNRAYGYYADVKNLCRVYHICSTKTDEFGVRSVEHYSFVCAKGLMFDQQKITCVPERQAATNCEDSEKYYARTADAFTRNVRPSATVDDEVPIVDQPEVAPPRPAYVERNILGRNDPSKVLRTRTQTWITRSVPSVSIPAPKVTSLRVIEVRPRIQKVQNVQRDQTVQRDQNAYVSTAFTGLHRVEDTVFRDEERETKVTLNNPVTERRQIVSQNDANTRNEATVVQPRGDHHENDGHDRNHEGHHGHHKEDGHNHEVSRFVDDSDLAVRDDSDDVQRKEDGIQYQQEQVRQEQEQQEQVRQEQVQQEQVQQEQVRQEQEQVRQEQEQVQQEQVRQEQERQEQVQIQEVQQQQEEKIERAIVYSGGRRVVEYIPIGNQGVRNPSAIAHNPSINQGIGQPGPSYKIDHNPRINQNVGPVGGRSDIDHNPSINQGIGQPAPSHRISHNPSISQNIPPVGGRSGIDHNPSINQNISPVGGRSDQVHNPSINQGVGQPSPAHRISHNPSINQNISPVGGRSGQVHNPNINQGVGPGAPSHYISHNPSIVQNVAAPGGSGISHNPNINQGVGQGAPGHYISHNPSINQGVGQGAPGHYISHNPSIRQSVYAQDGDRFYNGAGGHSISHSPSINQYVGQPSSNSEVISHSPTIYQVVAPPGSSGLNERSLNPASSRMVRRHSPNGSQGIAHNPSIHQIILRNSYQRPSRRRSPSIY